MVIPNLGTLFYVMLGLLCLVALHLLLYFIAKIVPKTDRARDKVSKYLYWNG